MKYTEMEMKVIKAIGGSLNYDKLEDNIDDNATALEIKETAEITGLSTKQVRGIFSSLEQKGLMYLEEMNMGTWRIMAITEEGLREYYRLFVNTEKEDEEMMKAMERSTGTEYKAKRIEGGFEVYTLDGELYKKLRESTFKKNFKVTGESANAEEPKAETKKPEEPKEEPKQESKKSDKPKAKQQPKVEVTGEKREQIIEKIKKIMALAEKNPSMEEGLAAALKAQELMAKFNIHQDEVELEEIKEDIGSIFVSNIGKLVLMAWRKQLALVVAKNFRCKCYLHKNAIAFRGYKQDTEIAAEVFKSLYIIGDKIGGKTQAKVQKETGSGKGVYNTYIAGFLKGIDEGFGEQCTALMIVVPKEVEEEYAEFSKNFSSKSTKSLVVTDAKVYAQGKADGKAAVKSRQIEKKGV